MIVTKYGKWSGALSRCSLFKGIEETERETMLECMSPRVFEYDRNDVVCIEGDSFKGIGVVLSGKATVVRENSQGGRIIMTILEPGDMFGEMAAFSGNNAWPATIVAQSRLTVFFMPPGMITGQCSKLCPSHRMLVVNMLEVVSRKAMMLNRKLGYLTVKSLRGKISSFLLEQYRKSGGVSFTMPMKRNELADFLNVSRPSLSREMCKMRDDGLISFQRSSVTIIDIGALEASLEG